MELFAKASCKVIKNIDVNDRVHKLTFDFARVLLRPYNSKTTDNQMLAILEHIKWREYVSIC
jgi:hypothetical protein